jgi:hypothetical protein
VARRKVGRTRLRMMAMLAEHGIKVDDLWLQEGGYRHHHWDLARWGGSGTWTGNPKNLKPLYCEKQPEPPPGLQVTVYSWDKMTECVRNGFTIRMDERGWCEAEVHAKPEKKCEGQHRPDVQR